MRKSIFISSTYQDLQLHRNQIWTVLQNFEVDVVGMENFGARKSKPLDTCIEEISDCDIYIGIISMCYGSVDEETGKSYTQLEYDKAKEKGLEILIYLIDERNGELKTGNIDFGDKYLRLKSFKNILKKNHTVDFFINEKDLGQKIYRDLEKIIDKRESNIFRPKVLDAKVFRIKLDSTNWTILIGYLNGKPFEIFSSPADYENGLILPKTVETGFLIKESQNKEVRFDFQFINKRGYKTTVEGIDFFSDYQITRYSNIISKLLQSNTKLQIIIDIIQEMEFENKKYKNWNNEIIRLLNE